MTYSSLYFYLFSASPAVNCRAACPLAGDREGARPVRGYMDHHTDAPQPEHVSRVLHQECAALETYCLWINSVFFWFFLQFKGVNDNNDDDMTCAIVVLHLPCMTTTVKYIVLNIYIYIFGGLKLFPKELCDVKRKYWHPLN